MRKVLPFAAMVLAFASCQKEDPTQGDYDRPALPQARYSYNVADEITDMNMRMSMQVPLSNQITDAGATLGRVLFYDTKLSLNNRTSCGSCHQQDKAFADGKKFAEGFRAGATKRNSPTAINTAFSNTYFWDMRSEGLENMVMRPVKDHVEMGMDNMEQLTEKLAMFDYYPALFEDAFGSPEITPERISKALAQFLRSMVSHRSRYDQGQANNFSNFTAEEQLGKDLFFSWDRTHCQNCHGGVNFSGWGSDAANIGLEMEYVDKGLKEITGVATDEGRFKVPSLRNVALTGPYMHDGRFATLEEVVDHYSHGAVANPYLDYRMGGNSIIIFDGGFNGGGVVDPIPGGGSGTVEPRRLDLTDVEKKALVAFLKTLTDEALISDPRYSDPFR